MLVELPALQAKPACTEELDELDGVEEIDELEELEEPGTLDELLVPPHCGIRRYQFKFHPPCNALIPNLIVPSLKSSLKASVLQAW